MYERELDWGVAGGELNHLVGRIGELYAAMITRGQMALDTNQKGYDVISDENERISVKTVTTTKSVPFTESTYHLIDRVIILRIKNDDDSGISIETLHDESAEEIKKKLRNWRFNIRTSNRPPRKPVDNIAISAEIIFKEYLIRQYESGTIRVERNGIEVPEAKPILRKIAAEIGVDILNGAGNQKNTRTLGDGVIKQIKAGHPK